ncbi:MAG: toll/interleukin-1 receptor domain-containing protein [Betaproteobacteria bacterium]|nr:toll/interleukin-1 receptor domain-containing protein [Betaproteobacteria bacterium]MDH5349500.1 toll/interleukin-1 receptor domain-containing protein [Betaproteobacteria bacterium]
MAGIFISYRRDDSDVAAGRLADDLSEILGPHSIFRDVDKLEPGEDFEIALDHALSSCVVLIAVIGARWSSITDGGGRRRLEDPKDWVRAEISRALARGIRVIPVLISGTTMPREEEVPVDLKALLKRQALELGDRHWKQDIELLTQALEKIPGITKRGPPLSAMATAMGRVTLVGSRQWFAISPQIIVSIDNMEVARMKLSDQVTVEIKPGAHTIYGKMPLSSSKTTTFDLEPGQTQTFSVSINRLTGGLRIELLAE